jgi:hypothetical protein
MIASVAHADTIRLKNGNTVEGKVIEKTADGIKVDIGGVTLTYYTDEIQEVSAAADVAAPVVVVDAAPEASPTPVVEAPVPVSQEMPIVGAVETQIRTVESVPVVAAPVVSDDLEGMNKSDLIKKFVQIYGVKENMQANFDQMTSTLKPDQAQAFRQSVKVDEIVDLLLPIYDKHFSENDLRAYIRFYSSAEGKKLVQTLPLLMKDSVDISMKYLDTHIPESLKQVQETPSGK